MNGNRDRAIGLAKALGAEVDSESPYNAFSAEGPPTAGWVGAWSPEGFVWNDTGSRLLRVEWPFEERSMLGEAQWFALHERLLRGLRPGVEEIDAEVKWAEQRLKLCRDKIAQVTTEAEKLHQRRCAMSLVSLVRELRLERQLANRGAR